MRDGDFPEDGFDYIAAMEEPCKEDLGEETVVCEEEDLGDLFDGNDGDSD